MNLLWIKGLGCGGDTLSFLNAEQPDVITGLKLFGIDILWHPSLSLKSCDEVLKLLDKIIKEKISLNIFIVEGSIPLGPDKTGKYFFINEYPFKDLVKELSNRADYVIALGTCASFGGIPAGKPNPTDSVGLQFAGNKYEGLLGKNFSSRKGFPVINIPGCPAHPDWLMETLGMIALNRLKKEDLDEFHRPKEFYSHLSHHGCPRNEFYEFKASAQEFGQQGCLFEYLGCKGTVCSSDCNIRLWLNRTGSCERGGFPCIACTSPEFPDGLQPFFRTKKIADIPVTLPKDVPKAWYIGISTLAKAATPERLKRSATNFKKIIE